LRQATVDTQTVKGLPVRGPHGYVPAKRVVGRKRVTLVAAEGDQLAGRRGRPRLRAGTRRTVGTRCWSGSVAILGGAFAAEGCRK
jgi:hypothetical protein